MVFTQQSNLPGGSLQAVSPLHMDLRLEIVGFSLHIHEAVLACTLDGERLIKKGTCELYKL